MRTQIPDFLALVAGASATHHSSERPVGTNIECKYRCNISNINPDYAITESDYSNDTASTTYSLYNISASRFQRHNFSFRYYTGWTRNKSVFHNNSRCELSYCFGHCYGNPIAVVSNYIFNNVDGNHTIEASFAINTFNLNYAAGTNGSITGSSTQTINYGASGTAVTAVPTTGYHFVNWSDGSPKTPEPMPT